MINEALKIFWDGREEICQKTNALRFIATDDDGTRYVYNHDEKTVEIIQGSSSW